MDKLQQKIPRTIWRIGVGIVGGVVLLAGIIMIPYPGPGWACVFIGLAILAQEFRWAREALRYTRRRYRQWGQWARRQGLVVQVSLFIVTCVVVIATIWLMNGYGIIDNLFHLNQPWAHSPFVN